MASEKGERNWAGTEIGDGPLDREMFVFWGTEIGDGPLDREMFVFWQTSDESAFMRVARIKPSEDRREKSYFHCVTRIVNRAFVIQEQEKEFMVRGRKSGTN